VVADVPGLIKGAHEGHGLGHQFLRHIERTKILVHLVDVSSASGREPVEDFDTIRDELRRFDEQVAVKPQIVVATKIDALDDPARLDSLRRHVRKKRLPFVKISAVSGDGLDELLETIWRGIVASREAAARSVPEAEDEGIDLITPSRLRHDA
jgi:GTP-binding protein